MKKPEMIKIVKCQYCGKDSREEWTEDGHEWYCRERETNEILEDMGKRLEDLSAHMGI